MRILILKRDKIGDMLLMTPMLEHLRNTRPDAEIHVLANDYNAWVVADNPNIDHLWVYPRTRHAGRLRPMAAVREWLLTRKLKKMHFDAVIAAGGVVSPRAIQRVVRIGGQRTIAYCPPDSPEAAGLTDPLPLPRHLHEVEANLALLEPLGIAPPEQAIWPRFRPAEACIERGLAWIREQGLDKGFIVIGINARREKRKPSEAQILAWAQAALERHGLQTVLVWQPGAADSKLYRRRCPDRRFRRHASQAHSPFPLGRRRHAGARGDLARPYHHRSRRRSGAPCLDEPRRRSGALCRNRHFATP